MPTEYEYNKHVVTEEYRELVRSHGIVGTPQEVIADIIGVTSKTLRKHYRRELDLSTSEAVAAIGGALYNKAMGGDVGAICFFLKTRGGFREKERDEDKAAPEPMTISFNVSEPVGKIKITNAKS